MAQSYGPQGIADRRILRAQSRQSVGELKMKSQMRVAAFSVAAAIFLQVNSDSLEFRFYFFSHNVIFFVV